MEEWLLAAHESKREETGDWTLSIAIKYPTKHSIETIGNIHVDKKGSSLIFRFFTLAEDKPEQAQSFFNTFKRSITEELIFRAIVWGARKGATFINSIQYGRRIVGFPLTKIDSKEFERVIGLKYISDTGKILKKPKLLNLKLVPMLWQQIGRRDQPCPNPFEPKRKKTKPKSAPTSKRRLK